MPIARIVVGAAMVALVLFEAGCATPAQLALTQAAAPTRVARTTAAEGRTLTLAAVEDLRPSGQELGRVGGRPFLSKDVSAWVQNAIADTLRHEGYGLVEDAPVTLKPRILKAYVDSVDIAKTSVVVLEVTYVRADGAAKKKIYRGQQQNVNWNSGEEEVMNSLRKALQQTLSRIVIDTRELSHPGNDDLWRD